MMNPKMVRGTYVGWRWAFCYFDYTRVWFIDQMLWESDFWESGPEGTVPLPLSQISKARSMILIRCERWPLWPDVVRWEKGVLVPDIRRNVLRSVWFAWDVVVVGNNLESRYGNPLFAEDGTRIRGELSIRVMNRSFMVDFVVQSVYNMMIRVSLVVNAKSSSAGL
jgi:hypothetical protein